MPSRSCRPRGQPVRVCAASSDAPAQGDARRAPLHAQALRRRESAAAIQARRYAPEKKQACEVRAYGNAAVAAAAATEATCALDIVVTRRCRAHLCLPRGNPEARGGLCQCHHNSLRSPSVMPFRLPCVRSLTVSFLRPRVVPITSTDDSGMRSILLPGSSVRAFFKNWGCLSRCRKEKKAHPL